MGCTDKKASDKTNSLAELVAEFLEQDGCCPRDEMKAYKGKPIKVAIEMAAQARHGKGKRPDGTKKLHPHQRWLRQETADKAEKILLGCVPQIKACKDFDALHELVKSKLQITGAKEMYWYDTAFRIGISMGVYPKKVYLHRRTKDGAKAFGIYKGKDFLELSELPAELRKMEPYQVEDFLCIKKDVLHKLKC
jgi:hypothetical protein